MPSKDWIPLLFETCEAGVSSAVAPELLPDNQNAWGMNIDVRGGKPSTRPPLRSMGNLPPGLIQGGEYFSIQDGMIVVSIAGLLYRIRPGNQDVQIAEIPLAFRNSALVKQVWMCQTVETLVIQDGQSDAILYDGSTAPRAANDQVPRGRQMAYGNGRLWVAVNANEAVAGDIRTGTPGSELYFTETNYLTGGGKLFFPTDITGMSFIPVTGQADYGALLVFCGQETKAVRADITSRDDWGKVPGFVTDILRSVGSASQWSIVSVNQDLYWRDSNGGIRSIRNALADEAGPGSSPVSREVSRLTDYDSQRQLAWCSGIYFDNRLLMTSSPFLMANGGVGFKNLISLDYAPLSSMQGKSSPAYNGQWNGLTFVKLISGKFRGKNRAFALTTDIDGNNQIWEFGTHDRADVYAVCDNTFSDGTSDPTFNSEREESPIQCFVEYPLRNFGDSKRRKRLERCDVWLSSVNGEVDLTVEWRADNSIKWNRWDSAETCAQTSDPSTATPHVWKNLRNQERPQFKTFTIPNAVDEIVKYAKEVGFEFQIRLSWRGRCRIHRMMLYGQYLDDPDYEDRAGFSETCVENDVSGNQITYDIPTDGCPAMVLTYSDGTGTGEAFIHPNTRVHLGGPTSPTVYTLRICNSLSVDLSGISLGLITDCPLAFLLGSLSTTVIVAGGCIDVSITFDPDEAALCGNPTGVVTLYSNGSPILSFELDNETHPDIPRINQQPEPATVEEGGEAQFAVTIFPNSLPTVYQWQVSGDGGESWNDVEDDAENYGGATTSTLTVTDVPDGFDGNIYRVRVRNEVGQVFSDEVVLTVGVETLLLTGKASPVSIGNGTSFTDGSPFVPFDTLQEAVDNSQQYDPMESNAIVESCIAICLRSGPSPSASLSSSPSSFTLNFVSDISEGDVCFFAETGDVITVSDGMTVPWTCRKFDDMSPVSGGPGNDSFVVPASGHYIISLIYVSPGARTVSSTGSMVYMQAGAAWDDSGTQTSIKACP